MEAGNLFRKPLLFLPGPMQVPDHVRAAGDKPLFSHRSQPMLDLLKKLESGLAKLLGFDGTVMLLASSGTGAMESAVCNMTSPEEEILVVVGGSFAERWVKIANGYGLTVRVAEVDWRTGGTAADVEHAMKQWPRARVVFVTWSESSTGVLIDLEEIGKLVRSQDKYMIVDAVSGLAVSPMRMNDWNVDVLVSASQKGLMTPAGLGVVAIGSRAWQRSGTSRLPRYYWDWKNYKDDVPFTPALSLLLQLEAALDSIHSQGPDRIYARRAEVAQKIRNLVTKSGMEIYALKPGNGITGVLPPDGFDIAGLLRRLESDFGIQIAEGLGRLKGRTFRIGHVGHVSDEELQYFLDSFDKCVR
jgi:aspartate aminotransferase-like enzyme